MKPEYIMEKTIKISECDGFARWRPSLLLNETQELAEIHAATFGLARMDLLKDDICWIIYRQSAKLYNYPTYHDTVRITTWPGAPEGPIFPRYFVMEKLDGTPICEMVAGWILMSVSTRRPLRPNILPRPVPVCDREPPIAMPQMLRIEGAEQLIGARKVCYSDVDVNGHMNNTRYLDWICDFVGMDALRERGLSHFQINYIAETLPGETLSLYAKKQETALLVLGKRGSDGRTVFEASVQYE